MKKTLFLISIVLCCFLQAGAQTSLLRIYVEEKSIDVVSTITIDHGITHISFSSTEGIEYFNGDVRDDGQGIRNTHLINDMPFERLVNAEQAKTWADCVLEKIKNCNQDFWCEFLCAHGVNPTCVIKWGVECTGIRIRVVIVD